MKKLLKSEFDTLNEELFASISAVDCLVLTENGGFSGQFVEIREKIERVIIRAINMWHTG